MTRNEIAGSTGQGFRRAKVDWLEQVSGRDLVQRGRMVIDFFGEDKLVAEIDRDDLADLKAHFKAKGNSGSTINRRLSALRMIAKNVDVKLTIPWMPEPKPHDHWLNDDQEAVVMAHWAATGNGPLADLTILLIDTGMRAYCEAGTLKWEDIQADRLQVTGKGGKTRIIPLTKRATAALDQRRHCPDGPFFGMTHKTIEKHWNAMRKATGYTWLTPHVLRHTCASRLVTAGVDIKRVQEWLGHSSVLTTMRYAKLAPDALFDVVNVLER